MSTLFRFTLCLACLGLVLGARTSADDTQPPVAKPVATPSVPPKALPVALPVAQPAPAPPAPPRALPVESTAPVSPNIPLVGSQGLTSDKLAAVNAAAKGLAGLATGGAWEATPEWKSYQQSLDGQWSYLDEIRLKAMRTWGATELADLRAQSSTVFYPFSGPDVLYADTFFPNSRLLLMAGLEPVGSMPDLNTLMAQGKLGPYLDSISKSLFTILAASFFKTKDMKVDFNNQLVDGIVPAMVVFLAREGNSITDLQFVSLTADGGVGPRSEGGRPGVQITYGDGRQLLYFQADLSDDGLKHNPGFVRLMHKLAPGITYLKAASYLCYYS
ncbi:MAG TPA: hypothetical protein VHY09_09970, partial [Candidatus Methylacidiphilales bacterium]|nr:hypothetical protein [Candidatus Methylacidiphilales bacterium]